MTQCLQELRNEVRREGDAGFGKLTKRCPQLRSALCVGIENMRRPALRVLQLIEPLHGAQGHAANTLDQSKAQHRRHRPQLADGERRDTLEGLDEQVDVLEIDARFAV